MRWLFVSSFDVLRLPSLLTLGIYSRKLLHSLSKKALFTSSVKPFPLYSIRMDWYCMHWLDSFIIIMLGFRCIDWSNYHSIKVFLLLLKSEQLGITPLWVEAFISGTKWGNLFWKTQILSRGPHPTVALDLYSSQEAWVRHSWSLYMMFCNFERLTYWMGEPDLKLFYTKLDVVCI